MLRKKLRGHVQAKFTSSLDMYFRSEENERGCLTFSFVCKFPLTEQKKKKGKMKKIKFFVNIILDASL